ncbi:PKD domain-containing protein [uncultured Winogradskyella sp.]|uniref:PKD domain-containing protein n=1 Tax=uncultured Winogradskyella sp. TaxID=395353 RepID=UPI002627C286|nr:PKD domain-containing protein [uncultured Winogradskyella sp.]
MKTKRIFGIMLLFVGALLWESCDIDKFEPLGENSIEDATPPQANFSFSNGVTVDDFLEYTFANLSTSATTYAWDFGDGNTSTDLDGFNVYPAEGTYTVTLTVSDNNGLVSTTSQTIEVIEPEAPLVPDPLIVNSEFVKLPKSSGSDCACAGWINRDLGDQGESSTASGADVVKFDNNEPDHVYQEFEVVPNADYLIEVSVRHSTTDGTLPSSLELRMLAGSGYEAGYTPVYYTDTAVMPQGNSSTGYWGYRTVAQMEDAANNLTVEVIPNPGNDDYNTYQYSFNAGANNSVALFMRGIGGAASGNYGYNSGNEEIRAAYVTITAVN